MITELITWQMPATAGLNVQSYHEHYSNLWAYFFAASLSMFETAIFQSVRGLVLAKGTQTFLRIVSTPFAHSVAHTLNILG